MIILFTEVIDKKFQKVLKTSDLFEISFIQSSKKKKMPFLLGHFQMVHTMHFSHKLNLKQGVSMFRIKDSYEDNVTGMLSNC